MRLSFVSHDCCKYCLCRQTDCTTKRSVQNSTSSDSQWALFYISSKLPSGFQKWKHARERKTCKAADAVKTRSMDDFPLSTVASKMSQDDVTLSPKPQNLISQPYLTDLHCSCWCYSVHSGGHRSALILLAHFTTIVTHFLKTLQDIRKTWQKVEKVLFNWYYAKMHKN